MIQFFLHFSLKYLNRKHGRCKTIDQRHVSLEKIPIALEKSYEMEAFVNGYHVHKEMWTPFLGEKLDTAMQPNNVKDKYAVAIFHEGKKKVIGHLPLGKSGKLAKTIFYFLEAAKESRYQKIIHGKAVNQIDGMGMKVPSRLLFTAEEKFIDILKERLPKLLLLYSQRVCNKKN